MKNQELIKQVKKQIKELKEKKAQQMEIIQAELSNAQAKKAAAEDAAAAAKEALDLDAWNRAAADKQAAESAEGMFSSRLAQIQEMEIIPEEDSDRVIDSLKDYIRTAENEFDADLKKILQDLRTLYDSHITDIQKAENVILTWTTEIHKNYRSPYSLFVDPETGARSSRSPFPVPVPLTQGLGGGHARMVRQFLSNFQTLINDPEEEDRE